MSLRLRLKPNERIIISGAVVRNGNSRGELFLENKVPVLREGGILSPKQAHTPCERVYLAIQLLYVDPQRHQTHLDTFRSLASDVLDAAPSCRKLLERVCEFVDEGDYYQALRSMRDVLDYERALTSNV